MLYCGTIRNPQHHGTYTVVVPTVWVRTGLCICVFKVESFNIGHWTLIAHGQEGYCVLPSTPQESTSNIPYADWQPF